MKKTKALEFGGGGDPLDRVNEREFKEIFNKDINPLPSTPTPRRSRRQRHCTVRFGWGFGYGFNLHIEIKLIHCYEIPFVFYCFEFYF